MFISFAFRIVFLLDEIFQRSKRDHQYCWRTELLCCTYLQSEENFFGNALVPVIPSIRNTVRINPGSAIRRWFKGMRVLKQIENFDWYT